MLKTKLSHGNGCNLRCSCKVYLQACTVAAGSATLLICVVLLPTEAGTMTESSKCPSDNHLHAPFFCNIFSPAHICICEHGACRPERGRGLMLLDTRPTHSKKQAPTFPENEEMGDESGGSSSSSTTFPQYCSWG